jgi:hypothetical protein
MEKRLWVMFGAAFAISQSALAHGPIFEKGLIEILDDSDNDGKGGLINLNLLEDQEKSNKPEGPDALIEVGNDRGNEHGGLLQIGTLVLGESSSGNGLTGGLPLLGATGGGNILQGVTGSGVPILGATQGGGILQGVTGGTGQSTSQSSQTQGSNAQGGNVAQGLKGLLGP